MLFRALIIHHKFFASYIFKVWFGKTNFLLLMGMKSVKFQTRFTLDEFMYKICTFNCYVPLSPIKKHIERRY